MKNKLLPFLFFVFFNLYFANFSLATIINSVKIDGNERISKETIIIFSGLEFNKSLSDSEINNIYKNLFETNYFKDIKFTINNNVLQINVVENPIIQSISIEGIKNKSIEDQLYGIVKEKEKSPFLLYEISEQKNLLLNVLKKSGFYFVNVEVEKKDNLNNSIDLIYNFDLGERAKIYKIKFIGDKKFKDSRLKNIILSEENKFWKFISNKKYLDDNLIMKDKNLLENYYKNKGYYNVKIKSSSAKILERKGFELIFNIDSGPKFFFGNVNLNLTDEYNDENFDDMRKVLNNLKGKRYSLNSIKQIIKEIDKIALRKEFIFVNAKYTENFTNDFKVNIDIFLEELDKKFVDRINIFGNYLTEESVIRNSLIVDEGDPFNKILFNKSINNIKARGLFKSVNAEIIDSNNKIDTKIINISVEEQPTGEIFAAAGTGTTGSTLGAGIKENNYLGRGIKVDTNIALSDDQIKGKFSVENPNFKNSDKSLKTTLESTNSDFLTVSGYKTSRTGLLIGTSFEQYENTNLSLTVSNYYEKLETNSSASSIVKKQEGDYIENLFEYGISINKLDQNYQPTDGYFLNFIQKLPIYSDDKSIENTFKHSKYHSVSDNLILSTRLLLQSVNSLDDDVRVSKRVYIPTSRLRGFSNIGPKDGSRYVGGNYGASLNINSTLPNVLSGYENIDINFFIDIANLWGVDYDSSIDSNKIRSSTGLALNWFSPIGPFTMSYAFPLSEASTDNTEKFRFQIGTSF